LGSNNIGPLTEPFVQDWLINSGNIVSLEINGSDLIGLIKKIKSSERYSPNKYILTGLDQTLEPDHASDDDFAAGRYTIHQKSINPSEKYTVVTSDKLIEKTSLVPELANASNIRRSFIFDEAAITSVSSEDHALSIQKVIIDYLRQSREMQKKEIKDRLINELPPSLMALSESKEPLLREKAAVLSADMEKNIASKINERYNLVLLDLFEGRAKKPGPYTLVNFKKIGFTYMKTNIENNENFGEVQNSRITTYDTTTIGFSSDLYFEMYDQRYTFTLGNKTDFAQTTFFIPDAENFENIAKDLTVSYAELFGKLISTHSPALGLSAGPFYELAYETQLKDPEDTDRKNSVVMIVGPKIAGGYILSEAKLGAIADFDYSGSTDNKEYGFYASAELTLPLLGGRASWENETEFKYFLDSGEDDPSDLGIEWSIDSELVLPFLSDFYLVPFANFLLFTGKVNNETGYGMDVGISFQFSRYWKPQFQRFLNW
jgi:hypothetical protein